MGFKALLISETHYYLRAVAQFGGELTLFGELLGVLSLITVLIVSYLSLRNMNRYNSVFDSFRGLIQKDAEGNILVDERVVKVVDLLGSRLFQSAKMSALQGMSVDSKTEKALLGAIAQDVVEDKLPLLDLAADYLGFNTKALIKKNPKAIFQLVGLAQKYGGGLGLGSLLGGQQQNNPGNRSRM